MCPGDGSVLRSGETPEVAGIRGDDGVDLEEPAGDLGEAGWQRSLTEGGGGEERERGVPSLPL